MTFGRALTDRLLRYIHIFDKLMSRFEKYRYSNLRIPKISEVLFQQLYFSGVNARMKASTWAI